MNLSNLNVFRLVHFQNPDKFIEATKDLDDNYMNFAIGALLDTLDTSQTHAQWGGESTLLGVYRSDVLLVTVTRVVKHMPWIISSPRDVKKSMDNNGLSAIVQLFVSYLPSIIDPKTFDKLIGPDTYVDAFLECWASHMTSNGLPMKLLEPFFRSKSSYATLETLPEPSAAFAVHHISQATSATDVEALAHLSVEFSTHGPTPHTIEEGREVMEKSVRARRVWVCRLEEGIAGYILVGRFTPRTVAIRNVYVSPSFRRRGIAEAMVRTVTRYYLGATSRLELDGVPYTPPTEEIKQEICLIVTTDDAERLYQKTGFMFGTNSTPGVKGWYASCLRGIELVIDT